MKISTINRLLLPAILPFLLAACKKNDAPVLNDVQRTQVNTWLSKQQTPGQTKRTAIAKGIANNLQWDKAWQAVHDKSESMLIIPIGKGYTFMNNRDKQIDNYLVLFRNSAGNIESAHIFQRLQGSLFTKNTIPGYYNSQPEDMDGTYWVLALHDIIYSELKYENNRLKEGGMPQTRPAANNRSTTTCVDWFWVHTVYDPETGWIISQTETYLGTSCTGCLPNTNQPQTTITAETEWDCMAGTGGEPEELEASTEKSWHAFHGYVHDVRVTVYATDRLRGKRRASEPQGGHFTHIRFLGLSCNNPLVDYSYTYQQGQYSNQTASSHVISRVNLFGENPNDYTSSNKTKTYRFDEVFN